MATLLNIAPDGKDAYVVDIDQISFIAEEYDGDIYLFYKDTINGAHFYGGEKHYKVSSGLRTLIQEHAREEFIFVHLLPEPEDPFTLPCAYYFPISSFQSFFTYKDKQGLDGENHAHIEMRLSHFGRIESSTYNHLPYSKINRILNLIELRKELVHIPASIATVSQIKTSTCHLDATQIKMIEIDPHYARINFINNIYPLDFKLPSFNTLRFLERCQRETPDINLEAAFQTIDKLEKRVKERALKNFLGAFGNQLDHLTKIPKTKYPTFIDVSGIFSIEHCDTNDLKICFQDEKNRPLTLQFNTIGDAKEASKFLTEIIANRQDNSKKRKKAPPRLNP